MVGESVLDDNYIWASSLIKHQRRKESTPTFIWKSLQVWNIEHYSGVHIISMALRSLWILS
jgi:hypothetical protein